MGGGLFAGSTTLLVGMTGAGKTTMALQFALEGVRRGEQALFINFQENPAQLRRAIAGLGADPAIVQEQGLGLVYASPVELQIDSIVVEIFEAIKSGDVRRLVIDAVGDLARLRAIRSGCTTTSTRSFSTSPYAASRRC